MFKNKRFWLGLSAFVIIVILFFLAWFFLKNDQPVSPPLTLILQPTAKSSEQPSANSSEQPTTTPLPPGICGQSGVTNILFMARDDSDGLPPFGADSIRYIRLDFNQKQVTFLAVPRDLWLATSVLVSQNIDNSRIGVVFYEVEQITTGDNKTKFLAASNAVAQTLYDNFQVIPDNYIFFEMSYFAQAIDNVGGLDVNIPSDISNEGHSFEAGPQHLNGERALRYARIKIGNELQDGWNRLARQNLILDALRAKALEPATYTKIPELVNMFWDDILTDLSPAMITSLICMINDVPAENIKMVEIDPSMIVGPGPEDSMIPDVNKVKVFMQEQLAP